MNHLQNWYVVYTKPRWEKKIARILTEKNIEHYCPLNKVERNWSDRKKTILEPLFKGYVFIKLNEVDKWAIKQIEGIINFVYYLGKPAIIRENEIEKIQLFLNEFSNIQVVENKINIKDRVEITQGILMNYKGIVLELQGNKAKVQIDSLGVNLIAFFDKINLKK